MLSLATMASYRFISSAISGLSSSSGSMVNNISGYITVKEAAKRLDSSLQLIYDAVKTEKLSAVHLDNGGWLLDTEVASYAGVARFVVGLMDDIKIVDTPELEQYIADYVVKFWPRAIEK